MVTKAEQFYPPFAGTEVDRSLNLLVNSNPLTFMIRGLFLTQPRLAEALGPLADGILRSQNLPGNLFNRARRPVQPLQQGDRVRSANRQWPGSRLFGGYILAIMDGWALVQWDFIPTGPLTYDPMSWLEPQVL